jgi:hypothetical protein
MTSDSDNDPATPCTRALCFLSDRVEQMKLQDGYHQASSGSETNDILMVQPAPPSPQDADEEEDSFFSSKFQTPSSRGKLPLVVTPPRIEKKAAFQPVNDHNGLQEYLPTPPLPPQTEPHGRKRSRGDAIQHPQLSPTRPPPIFPSSLEGHCPGRSDVTKINSNDVFGRLIPIHSPIAGIASLPNVEFMAQLSEDDDTAAISRLSLSPLSRRVLIMEHRDSFLARHSFPVLDDQAEEQLRSHSNEQPGDGGLVNCMQALKMRRRCRREEGYEDVLQVEKKLLL